MAVSNPYREEITIDDVERVLTAIEREALLVRLLAAGKPRKTNRSGVESHRRQHPEDSVR
jgi:hypothetical protein